MVVLGSASSKVQARHLRYNLDTRHCTLVIATGLPGFCSRVVGFVVEISDLATSSEIGFPSGIIR